MDLNLVVISGRLAAPAELRTFESGARLARFLISCRSDEPSRVDVIPVTTWDPAPEAADLVPGTPVWVAGSAQRRFWDAGAERRSRLEIVASEVCSRPQESQQPQH